MAGLFLALAGVVFVFLGPIGFFLTIGARGRLQIAERKILALEAQLRLPAAAPGTQTGEAPSAQPAQTEEIKPEGEREAAWANDSIDEAENPPSREQQTEPVEPPPLFAQPPRRSLEEALGAHWAVYVGGVALALGGLLLVRFSIEQGWRLTWTDRSKLGHCAPPRIKKGRPCTLASSDSGKWFRHCCEPREGGAQRDSLQLDASEDRSAGRSGREGRRQRLGHLPGALASASARALASRTSRGRSLRLHPPCHRPRRAHKGPPRLP
jgi:hypothetical protein